MSIALLVISRSALLPNEYCFFVSLSMYVCQYVGVGLPGYDPRSRKSHEVEPCFLFRYYRMEIFLIFFYSDNRRTAWYTLFFLMVISWTYLNFWTTRKPKRKSTLMKRNFVICTALQFIPLYDLSFHVLLKNECGPPNLMQRASELGILDLK